VQGRGPLCREAVIWRKCLPWRNSLKFIPDILCDLSGEREAILIQCHGRNYSAMPDAVLLQCLIWAVKVNIPGEAWLFSACWRSTVADYGAMGCEEMGGKYAIVTLFCWWLMMRGLWLTVWLPLCDQAVCSLWRRRSGRLVFDDDWYILQAVRCERRTIDQWLVIGVRGGKYREEVACWLRGGACSERREWPERIEASDWGCEVTWERECLEKCDVCVRYSDGRPNPSDCEGGGLQCPVEEVVDLWWEFPSAMQAYPTFCLLCPGKYWRPVMGYSERRREGGWRRPCYPVFWAEEEEGGPSLLLYRAVEEECVQCLPSDTWGPDYSAVETGIVLNEEAFLWEEDGRSVTVRLQAVIQGEGTFWKRWPYSAVETVPLLTLLLTDTWPDVIEAAVVPVFSAWNSPCTVYRG